VYGEKSDIRTLVRDIDLSVLRYADDTYHSAVCLDWASAEEIEHDEKGHWVFQLQAFLQFHDNNSSATANSTALGIRERRSEIKLLPSPSEPVFSQGTQNAR
jgi:hypothetical protein